MSEYGSRTAEPVDYGAMKLGAFLNGRKASWDLIPGNSGGARSFSWRSGDDIIFFLHAVVFLVLYSIS